MENDKEYLVVYYDSLKDINNKDSNKGRIRVRVLKCIDKDSTHYKFLNPETKKDEGILRTNIVRWESR